MKRRATFFHKKYNSILRSGSSRRQGQGVGNAINLSLNCPSLERVKACPPDQVGRGDKKYA
jgi:hypothetical protein